MQEYTFRRGTPYGGLEVIQPLDGGTEGTVDLEHRYLVEIAHDGLPGAHRQGHPCEVPTCGPVEGQPPLSHRGRVHAQGRGHAPGPIFLGIDEETHFPG